MDKFENKNTEILKKFKNKKIKIFPMQHPEFETKQEIYDYLLDCLLNHPYYNVLAKDEYSINASLGFIEKGTICLLKYSGEIIAGFVASKNIKYRTRLIEQGLMTREEINYKNSDDNIISARIYYHQNSLKILAEPISMQNIADIKGYENNRDNSRTYNKLTLEEYIYLDLNIGL